MLRFLSEGLDEDTFTVTSLHGTEALGRLFCFDLELASLDANVDLAGVLGNPATIEFGRRVVNADGSMAEAVETVRGRVSQVGRLDLGPDKWTRYRLTVMPRLWSASLHKRTRVFLKQTIPQILETVLKDTGLAAGDDYALQLAASYPTLEYVVQYAETDLAFFQRLCEQEGIFYFFTHPDAVDKVILADDASAYAAAPDAELTFRAPWSAPAQDAGVRPEMIGFHEFATWVPEKVELKTYNHEKPALALRVEERTGKTPAFGTVYEYGAEYLDESGGRRYAKIRAEEQASRRTQFAGSTRLPYLHAGVKFKISGHYVAALDDQEYAVAEVRHHARSEGGGGGGLEVWYWNDLTCVATSQPFRPARTAPVPVVAGMVTANVDASGDGQYAELDKDGRYKVKLSFDLSDRKDGNASHWVRMAQPYAGEGLGFHFPLHKGAEVLLTHVNGDPNRPLIAGAVPNAASPSTVVDENQTQSVVQTRGENKIVIEDQQDIQSVKIFSPRSESVIRIGKLRKSEEEAS
jgi:type VI secretion system secreted protein VgrG